MKELFHIIAAIAFSLAFGTASAATYVYVADAGNDTIMRYDGSGVGSVFASGLNNPIGLAFDAAGNLFVANSSHSANSGSIQKLAPNGSSVLFASTLLDFPTGIAVDQTGSVYAVNSRTAFITKFTSAGLGSVFAQDPGTETVMWAPYGAALDLFGNLYVSNFNLNTIVKITPAGVLSLFTSSGLANPEGLAFDALGNLYVANYGNSTIWKYNPSGVGTLFVSSGLANPSGIAFDGDGNLYAVNQGAGNVRKYSSSGTDLGVFASGLNYGTSLAVLTVPEPTHGTLVLIGLLALTMRRGRQLTEV